MREDFLAPTPQFIHLNFKPLIYLEFSVLAPRRLVSDSHRDAAPDKIYSSSMCLSPSSADTLHRATNLVTVSWIIQTVKLLMFFSISQRQSCVFVPIPVPRRARTDRELMWSSGGSCPRFIICVWVLRSRVLSPSLSASSAVNEPPGIARGDEWLLQAAKSPARHWKKIFCFMAPGAVMGEFGIKRQTPILILNSDSSTNNMFLKAESCVWDLFAFTAVRYFMSYEVYTFFS